MLSFNFFIFYLFCLYFYILKKEFNFLFKLYLLSVSVLIFFFLKIFNFFKKNNYENDFWYLVEILNNNNNSILLFIFLMIVVFCIKNNNYNFFVKSIAYYCCIFVTILIFLYDNTNVFYYNYVLYLDKINSNLVNGVVLIHPILVYYTYILFLIIFFKKNTNVNYNNKAVLIIKFEILSISLLGLFLGGYWAQQELNWGGWWNWDFVEIIALIFNVLALYLVHSNFYKYYNNIYIVYRNLWYYLFCFFFFVRVDILNSIHSFNSIAISNNYKFVLFYFILFLLLFIFIFNCAYVYKYKFNKINIDLVSIFFKCVNSLFLLYFLINLFFIFYVNYQFLDITKYVKILLLLLIYIYMFILFIHKKYFFVLNIIFFLLTPQFFISYVDTIIIINLLFLIKNTYKNIKNNFFKKTILHFSFFMFIVVIRYNYNQIYNNYIYNFSFFRVILNNDYVVLNYWYNTITGYFNNYKIILNNYYLINNKNNFYYFDNIYVNNLIKNDFLMVIYNLDNPIYLTLFNTYLLYFTILLVSVLIFLY